MGMGHILSIVVNIKTLLREPEPYLDKYLPWLVWGEANTRCFDEVLYYGSNIAMYRIATSSAVLDFNPNEIERDSYEGRTEGIVVVESKVHNPSLVAKEVWPRLPYRKVEIPLNMIRDDEDECYPGYP